MQFNITPISGDASFRRFFRLNNYGKKKILVHTKQEKYKNLAIYCAINSFLRKKKILAPKLYYSDYEKGIIIIEDFGNLCFLEQILKSKKKIKIYEKLIDLLIKIQKIKIKKRFKTIASKNYNINTYSNKILVKESNLFFEWYLPLIYSKKKIQKIQLKIKVALLKIYKKLYFRNSYFVHRDYHVSNLMKVGKKIGVLDSQDALIGNPSYDLVSIVDDVRIKTSSQLKKKIIDYYLKKTDNKIINKSDHFINDFHILSIQRNLKIIGIFSRLYKRDKKEKYLQYIPYAWKLLELRLKNKNFKEIKKILDKSIPKKIRKKIINEN